MSLEMFLFCSYFGAMKQRCDILATIHSLMKMLHRSFPYLPALIAGWSIVRVMNRPSFPQRAPEKSPTQHERGSMAPAWYNARKAAQVVAFFAKAEGGKINVLKLVKLIYLADREAMLSFEAPILQDKFVSMDHGPVNSITLNYINGLSEDRADWNALITDRSDHFIGLTDQSIKIQDLDELSVAELKVLELIWQRFGAMNQFEIRDYTHKNCPEWENPNGSSTPIPVERIFKFLGKFDSGALASKLESERIMDQIFARANDIQPTEEGDSAYALRATG